MVNDDAVIKEDATAEEKEPENVSSNLNGVTAAAADVAADDVGLNLDDVFATNTAADEKEDATAEEKKP